jgi:RNA polymerase sigma-70 factor, ECF subfamily
VAKRSGKVERDAYGLGQAAQHQFAAGHVCARDHRLDGEKTGAADVVHTAEIGNDPDHPGFDSADQSLGELTGRSRRQSAGDREHDDLATRLSLDTQSPASRLSCHGSPTKYTSGTGSSVSDHQDLDDLLTLDRCLAGDASAFEILVVRYQTLAFNVALRMLGNHADAADATQNTFVKLFAKLHTFDRQHRFFSWMYRILRNECLNLLRTRQRSEALAPPPATSVRDPAAILEGAEREATVRAGLLALDPPYREAIVLRYFADLSYQEMSAALDLPEKTVKSRLHTARQRLYQLFRECGVFRSGDR